MGLVLLLTFSKALGPVERVGLWVKGFGTGCNCDEGGVDDDDGKVVESVMDAEGDRDGTGVEVAVLLWTSCRTGCEVDGGVGRD